MNDKKLHVVFILVSILLSIELKCQTIELTSIIGDWKVVSHQSCISDSFADSIAERIEITSEKLESIVSIKETGISVTPFGGFNILECDSVKFLKIDNEVKSQDSVFINSVCLTSVFRNKDIQDLLNKIEKEYYNLEIIDTGCFCDFGRFTLKIIVLNRKRIIFFSGSDINLLERVSK